MDIIGGTAPILELQALPYVGDHVSIETPLSLIDALSMPVVAPGESREVLEDIQKIRDTSEGNREEEPELSFIFLNPDVITNDGGYIEIYEPVIYVPEGFDADDLYAVEFVLNEITGLMTISLYFSSEPRDLLAAADASLASSASLLGLLPLEPGLGDVSPLQAGGSKCTVTLTTTTTQTSGSSTVSFMGGLVNYTTSAPTSTRTTTKTIAVEGTMVNGRCVVSGDRR
jgi:hypothetical protein